MKFVEPVGSGIPPRVLFGGYYNYPGC